MYNADYFIEQLKMTAHPEGGFFAESFRSKTLVENDALALGHEGSRDLWSSIYFLLRDGEVSNFHRLKSDEMWYYQAGSALSIYMIAPSGELTVEQLGLDFAKGEKPQVLVPKGYIFGSAMNQSGFALVGCMVSPGFEFNDFELFSRAYLLNAFPTHRNVIEKLTRVSNE